MELKALPKKYVPKKASPEQRVQLRVCTYLRTNYPMVYFRCDTVSGLLLSKNQRQLHHAQQSGPCQPDMMIFEPRRGYHALLIEIKAPGTVLKRRDGSYVADVHIRAQKRVHDDLRRRGYFATFAVGYQNAVDIIDWYFSKPSNEQLAV